MEKINDNQLDDVVGGVDRGLKKDFSGMFPTIRINCAVCGKEIEITDDIKMGWGADRETTERHNYYQQRCHECALKKPYWRDTVVDGKIVKDGKIHELYKKL